MPGRSSPITRLQTPMAILKRNTRELLAFWPIKLPLVTILALLYPILTIRLPPLQISGIFSVDPALVVIASLFVVLDFATGIMRSVRQAVPITTVYARRTTTWKIAEHAVIVMVFTLIDNGFAPYGLFNTITQYFGEAAFFWVIITEGWSCVENIMLTKQRAGRVIKAILSFTRNPKNAFEAIEALNRENGAGQENGAGKASGGAST